MAACCSCKGAAQAADRRTMRWERTACCTCSPGVCSLRRMLQPAHVGLPCATSGQLHHRARSSSRMLRIAGVCARRAPRQRPCLQPAVLQAKALQLARRGMELRLRRARLGLLLFTVPGLREGTRWEGCQRGVGGPEVALHARWRCITAHALHCPTGCTRAKACRTAGAPGETRRRPPRCLSTCHTSHLCPARNESDRRRAAEGME